MCVCTEQSGRMGLAFENHLMWQSLLPQPKNVSKYAYSIKGYNVLKFGFLPFLVAKWWEIQISKRYIFWVDRHILKLISVLRSLWKVLSNNNIRYPILVYTKTVDSVDGARWLARQTPDILCYLPPSNSRENGVQFASVASEEIIQKNCLWCLLSHCFSIY